MKRLKKTVQSKNTTRKKNNGGMTYIELLVALSLLVLIVTMFSPMLLSSYDKIYRAGEKTSNAFNAKYDIEEGLAYREDHQLKDIAINFNAFGENLYYKARRVTSVLDGFDLETLYFGAKGKVKVVSSSVVADNQNEHSVQLQLTNLGVKKPKSCSTLSEAQSPVGNDLRFYVHSLFDDSKGLTCQFSSDKGHNKFIEMLVKGVDITKSPLKILAYYLDENGEKREIETYLDIEPADIMFVGKTNEDADYFTSAGVDKNGDLLIASRKMNTAAIGNGKTLNDVEWISPDEDSDIVDGYYLMCGNDSIVRRLWRARTTPKTTGIVCKNESVNGKEYFQYDWKGDFTDDYKHMSQAGAGASGYGDSLESVGNHPITRDKYGLNGSSHAYSFNGFTGGWYDSPGDLDANEKRSKGLGRSVKRISYIPYVDESSSAVKGEKGMWSRYTTHISAYGSGVIVHEDWFVDTDEDAVYRPENDTWYKRNVNFWSQHSFEPFKKSDGSNLTGLSFDKGSWVHGKNAMNYDEDIFFRRNGVPLDTGWSSSVGDWENKNVQGDEDIAYLALKMYNNFSSKELKNDSSTVSLSGSNPISLKSCSALPGRKGDTMYYGTTKANALIHQTTGVGSSDDDTRKEGLFTGYFFVALGEDGSGQPITKMKEYAQTPAKVITSTISPNWKYAISQLQSETGDKNTNIDFTKWSEYKPNGDSSKIAFTMGYASDLFTLYNSFTDGATKPLESSYMASTGVTTDNEKFHKNVWMTRDFYNIVESDSYGESVVAVGYNVSGLAKIDYNVAYFNNDGDVSSTFLNDHKNSDWEIDITKDIFTSNGWTSCKSDKGMYYLPGASKGEKFWIKLPKEVVANTALDRLLNDGVISVFNNGDKTFTNIYYHRDDNNKSIRFNCVSTFAIDNSTVGAAVGMSNGGLMLVPIAYTTNGFVKTAVNKSSTTETGAIDEITSISAIKALAYDYDSDGANEALIIAGGVRATGKQLVLRVWDVTDTKKPKSFKIQLDKLGTATDVSEITDIAIVNDYIYVSGRRGTDKGVIFSCPLSRITEIAGKESQVDPINEIEWLKTVDYYTDFTFGSEAGEVTGGTKVANSLPVINSIAAKAEQ